MYKIRVEGKLVSSALKNRFRKELEKAVSQATSDTISEMGIRIQQGRDVNNASMAEYVPSYARYRQRKGRPASPPDLHFTGRMLAAITHKLERVASGLRVTIFFGSKAEADKARGNLKKRKFFGLTSKEKKLFVSTLDRKKPYFKELNK